MKLRLVLLAAFAAVTFARPGNKPEVIKLADGQKIFGVVVEDECRNEHLVVRDIRRNQKLTVAWEKVAPADATKLRVRLGFEVEDTRDTLKIVAHWIKNRSGVSFTGLLLNEKSAEKEGFFRLKTADRELKIFLKDVREGPEPVEVNALVVYTPLELYNQKLAESPPENAEGHFRLAEFASSVGALEKAKEHYETVLTFENAKYHPDAINRQIARVDKLLGQAEALADLKKIRQSIIFKKYDQATRLIEAFKEQYKEDADLVKEADKLAEESKTDREHHYIAQVARQIPIAVKYLITQRLKEKELEFGDAKRYAGAESAAEDGVTAHAIERVCTKLSIQPEEMIKFWDARNAERKRSVQKAFYRDGTFIVIDNLREPKFPKVKPPKSSGGGRRGGGGARVSLPKPRKQMTPDEWWTKNRRARKTTLLKDFLFAWWVEHSGLCVLLPPKESPCPICSGKGYVQQMVTSAQGNFPYYDRCGTCHTALHFRVVQWR